MSNTSSVSQSVDTWLQPLDGEACGPDLEYDAEFLELGQAAAGKPETQFAAAEPPQWPQVRDLAESLMGRTRDLRVALPWCRAQLNMQGLSALPDALRLLGGLVDNFWDGLHPQVDPDDGDAFARISVLGSLDKLDGLLGDVRQSLVLADRRLAGLRVREVEIARERLAPRSDESPRTAGQIEGMLADLPDIAAQLRALVAASQEQLKQLQRVMNDRFGIDQAVDVKALRGMLDAIASVLPPEADMAPADVGGAEPGDEPMRAGSARRGGGLPSIESRQDAIKAIDLICQYLEASEPTNPAQLLLRRAQRLIEKNFLELVRDLAPDAVNEIARIMGVDPDTIGSGGDSGSY